MAELVDLYRTTRLRIAGLAAELSDAESKTSVAACPGWSVKDVISHMTGVAADLTSGRMPSGSVEDWTAAQVEARRDRPMAEVLEEWSTAAPKLEEMIARIPQVGTLMVGDVFTHEQDIRSALGREGARDEAVAGAMQIYTDNLAGRIKGTGLGALRVQAGSVDVTLGDGEPKATVSAEPFELLRALTGRRTRDEVAALDWDGDAEPYIEVFSNYGWPDSALGE